MAEQPKYLVVADTLRREIAEGVFTDGQTLMTEEELRLRFNVSRQTVRQAIALLEDDGLVDRRRGSGTYVRHGPRQRQGSISVGVITTYITDYIFPNIVGGIENVLSENGCVMSLSATYNDPKTERAILERMIAGGVDGLIVEGTRTAEETPNRDLYQRLAERNIPVLFMNTYYPALRGRPHVIMDDYGGGRMAAREIIARGYSRPAFMFKEDDLQGRERGRGFLDETTMRGVDVPAENRLWFTTEDRMNLFASERAHAFLHRLADGKSADCLVCYNDVFALNVIRSLADLGCRVPEDLGMISFDNAYFAEVNRPALTTLGHPKEEFGAMAAEKLLRMIEGEKERSMSMAWTLVERETLPRRG